MTGRRLSLLLTAAWVAAVAGVAWWLLGTRNDVLREQLKSLQFWSLEVCFLAGLIAGAVILKELRGRFRPRDAALMGVPVALSLLLTLLVAPRTNRIYYDEQIYQSAGQNLTDVKRAQICNDGIVEYGRLQCQSAEYNKQPYAYPHVLSLVYRAAGVHPAAAFLVNALAMALTVAGVYVLVALLFKDREPAFFAALLVALTPQQIIWSATAAVEPSASLALVMAILSAAWARRSNSTAALAGAAIAFAYAVQFRPESLLVGLVCVVILWPRLRDELARRRLWAIALLLFVLLAVHLGHMYAVRNVEWGTTGARFAINYVAGNFRVNGPFFLGDERFPVAFTVLALIGLWGRRFLTERLAVVLYFALFWGIGLLFYAGSYNYGADVRYSVLTVPPIAILGGLGAARVAASARRFATATTARAAVGALLIFQFLLYAPLVRATTEEAWAARADVRFAEEFVKELPANVYILTHNPGMFHLWGVNAGQMSLPVSNPAYLELLRERFSGGVYVHWNFWCNVRDPVQTEFCRKVLALKPVALAREHRERDQRFAFYRFN